MFVLTFAPGQELPNTGTPVPRSWFASRGDPGSWSQTAVRRRLSAGDILLVEGEEEFAVRNTGSEALVLLASLSPNPSDPR